MFIVIGFILTVLVSVVNGVRLVVSKEVQQSTNTKYRIACYFIAFACFGLAIGNIAHILRNGLEYAPIEVCSMISLSISVFQALLVTAAMVMLYTNRNVVVKKFIIHAIPFLLFSVAYIVAIQFQENQKSANISDFIAAAHYNVPSAIRLFYFIFYIVQLILFTIIFFRERSRYISYAVPAIATASKVIRLEWVKYAFLVALLEGILSISIMIIPSYVTEMIFRVVTFLFYLVFPIYYINYSRTYNRVKAMLANTENETSHVIVEENNGMDQILTRLVMQNNELFKKCEAYIVQEKCYLNPELKVESIVTELGTNRTYLANAIKQNTGQTIGEFILSQRLKHAQDMLKDEQFKKVKIEDIAIRSGFNSLRTFHRNFKASFGITPEEYRKKY
ncbi:MAG: helix-turn-helix transcriptional regulator [Paludibacteraceae bacterium]|nr:helix-turn-helix transcriptional regulator [Paludibacteraceae bacterium]